MQADDAHSYSAPNPLSFARMRTCRRHAHGIERKVAYPFQKLRSAESPLLPGGCVVAVPSSSLAAMMSQMAPRGHDVPEREADQEVARIGPAHRPSHDQVRSDRNEEIDPGDQRVGVGQRPANGRGKEATVRDGPVLFSIL